MSSASGHVQVRCSGNRRSLLLEGGDKIIPDKQKTSLWSNAFVKSVFSDSAIRHVTLAVDRQDLFLREIL
jgi:hypothetical protein